MILPPVSTFYGKSRQVNNLNNQHFFKGQQLSRDYFPLPDIYNLFDFGRDDPQGGGVQHADLLFPTLNKEQQRFAVNPAYPGYTARIFGNPTDPSDEDKAQPNDEVVEDPFLASDLSAFPKKASLKALVEGDPRVLAHVIEDERINDYYFISNFLLQKK